MQEQSGGKREDVEANLNLLELLAPTALVGDPPSTADHIHNFCYVMKASRERKLISIYERSDEKMQSNQ